jgi:hypothetical protein
MCGLFCDLAAMRTVPIQDEESGNPGQEYCASRVGLHSGYMTEADVKKH